MTIMQLLNGRNRNKNPGPLKPMSISPRQSSSFIGETKRENGNFHGGGVGTDREAGHCFIQGDTLTQRLLSSLRPGGQQPSPRPLRRLPNSTEQLSSRAGCPSLFLSSFGLGPS